MTPSGAGQRTEGAGRRLDGVIGLGLRCSGSGACAAAVWLMLMAAGGCRSIPRSAEPPSTGLAQYAAALSLIADGKYDEAAARLSRAIELDAGAPVPRLALANLKLNQGDPEGALRVLREADRACPGREDVARAMAAIYLAQMRWDEAIAVLQAAVAKAPASGVLVPMLCGALMARNRMEDAVATLRRAVQAGPPPADVAGAVVRMAMAVGASSPNDSVRGPLRRLMEELEAASTGAVVRAAAADAWLASGDVARAQRLLETEFARDPFEAEIRDRLARLHLSQNRLDEAIAVLNAAVTKGAAARGLRSQLAGLLLRRADRAEGAAARADLERAATLLQAELSDGRRSPRIVADLGRALLLLGRWPEAMAALSELPADSLAPRQMIVRRLLRGGDTNAVIEHLRALVRERASDPLVRHCLAEALLATGDRAGAIREFEAAAMCGPRADPPSFVRLAAIEWNDGCVQAAHRRLDEGLRHLPNHSWLLRVRAMLHLLNREFESALKTYEDLETLTPVEAGRDLSLVKAEQAVALQYMGRPALAARRLGEVWEPVPVAIEMFTRLALDVGRRLGDHEPTSRTFAHLAQRMPEAIVVPMYRGLWALSAERYAEAVEAFEQAERLALQEPGGEELLTAQFWFSYGSALERNRRLAEAEEKLERSLRKDSELAEAWNYLAYMWAERGERLDQAMRYVEEALKREPDNGAFLDTRGWIFYQQGRYAEALADLKRAREVLAEDDPTVLDHLGDTLEKLGRRDEAIRHWSRAFVLEPDNDSIRKKLVAAGVDLASLQAEADNLRRERERKLRSIGLDEHGDDEVEVAEDKEDEENSAAADGAL